MEVWVIVLIVVGVIVGLLVLGFLGLFIYSRVSTAKVQTATKPILSYSKTGAAPAAADSIYDQDGLPLSTSVNNGKFVVYENGPSFTKVRESLDLLRRHFLIPVDISRNPASDPKQTFLMHPKKFASQLESLIGGHDLEFIRNVAVAVLIERSIVQSPALYAETVKTLFAPLQARCPEIEELFAQLGKTPQNQVKNAECLSAALKSADRRCRFIAVLATAMLVFTRDNAPVALKVVEFMKNVELSNILSCYDVDPLAFATFERAVKVRSPMGRPSPSASEIAQDAVKRGFSHAVSASLLSPLQYPVPAKPIPPPCVADLVIAAKEHSFLLSIADTALALAVEEPMANPVMLVMINGLVRGQDFGKTNAALKKVQGVIAETVLEEEDQQALAAAQEAVGCAQPEEPVVPEEVAPEEAVPEESAYPGDATIPVEEPTEEHASEEQQ